MRTLAFKNFLFVKLISLFTLSYLYLNLYIDLLPPSLLKDYYRNLVILEYLDMTFLSWDFSQIFYFLLYGLRSLLGSINILPIVSAFSLTISIFSILYSKSLKRVLPFLIAILIIPEIPIFYISLTRNALSQSLFLFIMVFWGVSNNFYQKIFLILTAIFSIIIHPSILFLYLFCFINLKSIFINFRFLLKDLFFLKLSKKMIFFFSLILFCLISLFILFNYLDNSFFLILISGTISKFSNLGFSLDFQNLSILLLPIICLINIKLSGESIKDVINKYNLIPILIALFPLIILNGVFYRYAITIFLLTFSISRKIYFLPNLLIYSYSFYLININFFP